MKTKQESVWDYPRPPRLEQVSDQLQIVFAGEEIVRAKGAFRVLETSHPPVYYIDRKWIKPNVLQPSTLQTYCEWKGIAVYSHVFARGKLVSNAAWSYANPTTNYESIANHVAFYPAMMDACFVNGELVSPQPGQFYGGWITKNIKGPFKG
jgi:uncharacterized protein (DUF427 family)